MGKQYNGCTMDPIGTWQPVSPYCIVDEAQQIWGYCDRSCKLHSEVGDQSQSASADSQNQQVPSADLKCSLLDDKGISLGNLTYF